MNRRNGILLIFIWSCVGVAMADQTPAQWRAMIEAQPDPEYDLALKDLQEGCRIEVTTRNVLKPSGNGSLENFRAWTNSTGTYTAALYTNILHRWRNNLALTATQSNHLAMVQAAYLRKAWDSAGAQQRTGYSEDWDLYATSVRTEGERVMTKGYLGAWLSDADIEALREYSIYIQMQLTGAERLPHQLGLTRDKSDPWDIGEAAPQIMLRRAETVFDSPAFTNAALQDMTMFLKPKGALEALRLFTGYTNNAGTCTAVPFPALVGNEVEYVRLQTNGTKPVVLMMGKTSDVFFRRNIPIMDTLYQAYADVADIYLVHISYHDSFSTAPYYYGPYAGTTDKIPWQWTEEDFAQDVRRSMIRYPSLSIPFLMDEESHRHRGLFFTDGGDAHFVIIDREGKIAYAAPRTAAEGQNPFDAILQVNDVEYELRKVLANDGLAEVGRDRGMPNPLRQALVDAGGTTYRPAGTVPLWLTGEITNIDPVSQIVTVTRPAMNTNVMWGYNIIEANDPPITLGASWTEAPKNLAQLQVWIGAGEKEYRFFIGTGSTNFNFTADAGATEVFLNGLPVWSTELAVGDFVGVQYDPAAENEDVIEPVYFRASRVNQQIMVSDQVLSVHEGTTNSVIVWLAKPPTSDVEVVVQVSGDHDLSLMTASPLTFTSADWNIGQPVLIFAASDADALNGQAWLELSMSGVSTVRVMAVESDEQHVWPPAKDWRLIPWQIFDSAGSPAVSNLLRGVDGYADSIPAAGSRTLTAHLPPMSMPGMLTYSFGATNAAIRAEVSTNSSDGVDGIWQALDTWTYRPKDNYMIDRLQKIELTSNATPSWVRLTISNQTTSAMAVSNLAMHVFNAAGTNDYWVWMGASIQEMSIRHEVFKQMVRDRYGYDPVVFLTAVGGWTSGSLAGQVLEILTNHPNAKYVAVHIGGNDVTGGRPYPGYGTSLSNNLETIFSTIRQLGKTPVISRISFRAYATEPAVVTDGVIVNEENGSLPYNTNIVDQLILKYAPAFYDGERNAGIMDPYTYFLNHTNELSVDGVHVGPEGKQSWNRLWADAVGGVVYPTNASPSVQMVAATTSLTAGAAALFSASAYDTDGVITNYSWNFGDGTSFTNGLALTNATHRFLLSGAYTVTVTAQDDSGATNGNSSAQVEVSVTGSAGAEHHILIDIGSVSSTGSWNNVSANTLGIAVTNLVTDAGLSSGISLELTDAFWEFRNGNSVAGTCYPTTAVQDYGRLSTSAPVDASGGFTFRGLNTNLLYDFTFYGGCTLSYGPTTRYTIGGSNVVLYHYNNVSNTASICGVVPAADGSIDLEIHNDGTGNGILNVIELRYVIPGSMPSQDDDLDGLPNDWEVQYFGGPTNAHPEALAANGLNTVRETYIAGLDPTDETSFFQLQGAVPLEWASISGRVYSVYWTSNLLYGFQAVQTNIQWPQHSWTDQVYATEGAGYYRIQVELLEQEIYQ